MRISKAECPWCGHEILKPGIRGGICEYCQKSYHTMIFEYSRNRFTQKCRWRRQVSLIKTLIVWYCVVVLVLFLSARMIFNMSFFFKINGLILGSYFLYATFTRNWSVHLIRAKDGEAQLWEGMDMKVSGRRVFLEGDYDIGMYRAAFEIQVLNPETGQFYESFPVRLNLEEDLKAYIELTQDSPDCLKKPGMYFQLYDGQGGQAYCGVTEEQIGEYPGIFQVQIMFNRQEARLDKKCVYKAYMQTGEGENIFYLVPQDRDPLESVKTGKEVYEVQLLHHSLKAEKLLIPTHFCLRDKEGTPLGEGELTYHFANRFIISGSGKQGT